MALDILHDNWGPYTHTEVENALKAYLTVLENRINQAIQSGGVGMADLSAEVQTLLNKANTALQPENIAAWAKAQNKPGYTVSEITGVEGFQNLLAKLQDMDQKIQAAAASGGVDPDDEMSSTSEKPVQNKVIKAYVDGLIQGLRNVLNTITQDGATQGVIDTFNEVKAFLEGISSSDTLAAKLATLVPQTRTINGKALSSNVTIGINDIDGLAALQTALSDKLESSDLSVSTNGDGTIFIVVKGTIYEIDLRHTHEKMAKIEVHTQSTLPATKALDTIYAQVDNEEIPTEIQKLFIAGVQFNPGAAETGEPQIVSPTNGVTIDMGYDTNGVFTKQINIRAKNISTAALTVAISGTGYSLSYGQLTGQSSITIPAANALLGELITIVCDASSSTNEAETGTLVITSTELSGAYSANLVAQLVRYETLSAIKLTGTQWLQTDYYPNQDTEFELDCKFTANSNTNSVGGASADLSPYFMCCEHENSNRFNFQTGGVESVADANNHSAYRVACYNNNMTRNELSFNTSDHPYTDFVKRSVLMYKKTGSSMLFSFNGVSATIDAKSNTMLSKLAIGYSYYFDKMYTRFDLTIYSFKISENGSIIRNYIPKKRNGVPGLYDTISGQFISSKTSTQVEFI